MKSLSFSPFIFVVIAMFFVSFLVGCSNSVDSESSESDDGDAYPEKNITMIVPFAPGGGTDTAARALVEHVEAQLPGTSLVVQNVAGGGGVTGASEIYNAEPDGYTIGIVPQSPIAIQPHYGETEYNYDGFEPVLQTITMPQGMIVNEDAPWKSAEEWLEDIQSNPGSFRYGTSGHGGEQHLAMIELNQEADIKTEHIPFSSGGESITGVTGGHIDGAIAFPRIADPEANRLLFTLSEERSDYYPEVPTMKELGFDVVMDVYFGIVAPEGVAAEKIQVLHDAFEKALEEPGLHERMEELGFEVTYADASEYQQRIEDDYKAAEEIIQNSDEFN